MRAIYRGGLEYSELEVGKEYTINPIFESEGKVRVRVLNDKPTVFYHWLCQCKYVSMAEYRRDWEVIPQ